MYSVTASGIRRALPTVPPGVAVSSSTRSALPACQVAKLPPSASLAIPRLKVSCSMLATFNLPR